MPGLEIVVDGRWQTLDIGYGGEQMSTVWPGGSDELTWAPPTGLGRKARGGEMVQAFYGGVPVWAGTLSEPDASQPTLTATGAFKDATGWPALDSDGDATSIPDVAIDQAIADGLRWRRPTSFASGTVTIDLSGGPADLTDLLDTRTQNATQRWGVDPTRAVYAAVDPTVPTLQVFQKNGLGFALDNYASTLKGRYLDSSTHAPATATATDTQAAQLHGTRIRTLDLTSRGPISLSSAQGDLTGLLKLGVSTPSWTEPIVVTYGGIFTAGCVPVALQRVAAGQMLRVHGGYDLAARLNGQTYLDVVIGQTMLDASVLTIQPLGFVGDTWEDAMTAAIAAIGRKANR